MVRSIAKNENFWDIDELRNPIALPESQHGTIGGRFGPNDAYYSHDLVTFDGHVYWGYSVNWAMWGKMIRLCNERSKKLKNLGGGADWYSTSSLAPYSEQYARGIARGYKLMQLPLAIRGDYDDRPIDLSGTLTFITYGYTGSLPKAPWWNVATVADRGRHKNISPRLDVASPDVGVFSWRWYGFNDGVKISGGIGEE